MSVPLKGKDALVYVSAAEISGGNAWAIDLSTDSFETPEFGDTWKKRVAGQTGWSGSITAWLHNDSKTLTDAAAAGVAVALLIYPVRSDQSDYFSGNAIFGSSLGGGVGGGITRSGDFVGTDTLLIAGFS